MALPFELANDPPKETEASPVLLPQGPDEKQTFHHLVPQVTNAAELLQFHAFDQMIKDLGARRKAENQRLLALEKLWEVRKSELEPQLRALVAVATEAGGEPKAMTLLATTYLRDREDSVNWESEHDVLDWWSCTPELPRIDAVRAFMAFTTSEARAFAKQVLLARAHAGLDIPPGVTITPAGKTVVTRARTGRTVLTAHQVLAQHSKHLDRLVSPEEEGDDSL